jgi:hypothetical protein
MCLFCGETNDNVLEAAHIIDVGHAAQGGVGGGVDDVLAAYGVVDLYDPRNGLTLCETCHSCFDANLCCVAFSTKHKKNKRSSLPWFLAYEYSVRVSDALMTASSSDYSRWLQLNNMPIAIPDCERFRSIFPTPKVLSFRIKAYQLHAEKRPPKKKKR